MKRILLLIAVLVVFTAGCTAATLNIGQNEKPRQGITQPEGEVGTGTHTEGIGGAL